MFINMLQVVLNVVPMNLCKLLNMFIVLIDYVKHIQFEFQYDNKRRAFLHLVIFLITKLVVIISTYS
jgi:hypothetical protein